MKEEDGDERPSVNESLAEDHDRLGGLPESFQA